ncbi:hypothetical protein EW785_24190 [Salmonella enterica]|nr:hypothetical protein [Salmonella enterica]
MTSTTAHFGLHKSTVSHWSASWPLHGTDEITWKVVSVFIRAAGMITVPDNCHCWPVHSPCFPHCASDGIEDKHFQHATRESPAAGIDDHSWYLHTSMQAGLKRFHHPHAGCLRRTAARGR